jgi:hypothetical protein
MINGTFSAGKGTQENWRLGFPGVHFYYGACDRVVGLGTMLQAGRLRVRFPIRSLDFFNLPNPSSRTMTLGSTQPPTEMSTTNLPQLKGVGRPL